MVEPRPLNIAMLAKDFSRSGGMERYALEMARAMLDRGHRLELFCRNCATELLPGAVIHRLPERFRFSSVVNAWDLALTARRQLTGRLYDVVHSHERAFCQDVLTLHCFSFRGGLERYQGWRRLDQHYCSLRNRLYLALEARQMQTPRLVAVSSVVRDEYLGYYQPSAPPVIIPPGVDGEWFHPERIREARPAARRQGPYDEQRLVVLLVGSEFQRKGLDLLLAAVARTENTSLLVAGRGERPDYYAALVRQLGLSKRVRFAGLVADVRAMYAAADVVALPSRSEAFGMTVLEGMACGLPVIVAPNAGAAALVEHGVNGFVAREAAAVAAIFNELQDPQKRAMIGAQARNTATAHGWRQTADAYEALYYQVAKGKGYDR